MEHIAYRVILAITIISKRQRYESRTGYPVSSLRIKIEFDSLAKYSNFHK